MRKVSATKYCLALIEAEMRIAIMLCFHRGFNTFLPELANELYSFICQCVPNEDRPGRHESEQSQLRRLQSIRAANAAFFQYCKGKRVRPMAPFSVILWMHAARKALPRADETVYSLREYPLSERLINFALHTRCQRDSEQGYVPLITVLERLSHSKCPPRLANFVDAVWDQKHRFVNTSNQKPYNPNRVVTFSATVPYKAYERFKNDSMRSMVSIQKLLLKIHRELCCLDRSTDPDPSTDVTELNFDRCSAPILCSDDSEGLDNVVILPGVRTSGHLWPGTASHTCALSVGSACCRPPRRRRTCS